MSRRLRAPRRRAAPGRPAPDSAQRSALVDLAAELLGSDPPAGGPVAGGPVAGGPGADGQGADGPVGGARASTALSAAADERTRVLVDGFVHAHGPAPARFAWVALGSHARGELHCASDQDHALIWADDRAAIGSYALELAGTVIDGLVEFGMRRCDGGYMADRWSLSLAQWVQGTRDRIEEPTPQAVLDLDVFLDLRPLAGDLDVTAVSQVLATGAQSARLMHGLATSATSFPTPLVAFGRLPHGQIDLKRTGLAPLVLLARLYGLQARSPAVSTSDRLAAAAEAGLLSAELVARLRTGFEVLADLRLAGQVGQINDGLPISDRVDGDTLTDEQRSALREALRAIKATQSVTAVTFRTGL
ncbi:MAG: putative nucleotidyltransferase substrate binding domain-containing protein [Candidatus Nanopelagicales bacterium]